jgi:hypothetical protein
MNEDRVVRGEGYAEKVIAFAEATELATDKGMAIAFGAHSVARSSNSVGYAISCGSHGVAEASTAVSISSSYAMARASRLAVALNHAGKAIGREIAIAENLDSEAHSEEVAVAVGPRGLADGRLAISLGKEGKAIARDGGTIALAYYEKNQGHWEYPHGCDPTWFDGDENLSGLKVSKVGENGIRANYIYQLDDQGEFKEIGPASAPLEHSQRS